MTKNEAIDTVIKESILNDDGSEIMYLEDICALINQIDEPKLNWTSYCETCSHNKKLPPYCDKCKNHELVPYGWDYDESRESITGA